MASAVQEDANAKAVLARFHQLEKQVCLAEVWQLGAHGWAAALQILDCSDCSSPAVANQEPSIITCQVTRSGQSTATTS